MVYKKYIKRGGKVYGPYIYHSKRVDGKVVSEYHGTLSKKIDYKKFLWVGLGILILAFVIFGVYYFGKGISGKVIFDANIDYVSGQPLNGFLKFSLKQGELLPESSKIILENNGKRYEYLLKELISENTVAGDFYIEGKNISGTGEGYGLEGIREFNPDVYFTLEVYSEQETSNSEEQQIQENNTEENGLEQAQEQNIEENTTNSGITGNVVSFLFGWVGTGNVVAELQREIEGVVSKGNAFTYDLVEGETAEIKPKSVRTDSGELDDNLVNLKIEDNKVIVTTDYSEKQFGFGRDYIGEKSKILSIDLSDLNLILNEGDLRIILEYNGEELESLTTFLQEGKIPGEKIKEEIIETNKTIKKTEEITQETINPINLELTNSEKAILIKEFGSINIKTIREEIYNGRLIIGSQLRDYKIEHSYDYPQDPEKLKSQIELDRTKWLKDIAATLARKASIPEKIDIINDSYIV